MRYLSKQFETDICKAYHPFLSGEWDKKKRSELFFANYGAEENVASEKQLRQIGSIAAQWGKRKIVAELPDDDANRVAKFYSANGVNCMEIREMQEEEFSEYYMRLGYFLGEGIEAVNVALFEPDEEECRMFSKHGIAYHILTNIGMTMYGYVEENKIGCGKCRYDFLVLSAEAVLNQWSEQYVREFLEKGGKLLLLGEASDLQIKSTCTFGEIARAQLYRNKNTETEIYTTYRKLNEMQFLYVANVSKRKRYEQNFDFGSKVRSFLRLNLMEMTTEQVPLQIALEAGEDAILIPYAHEIEKK